MSLVIPVTYSSTIAVSDIQANGLAVQDYVNGEIAAANISTDNLDYQDFVKPFNIGSETRFSSGNTATRTVLASIGEADRHCFITNHIKSEPFNRTTYVNLEDLSLQVHLEYAGIYEFHAYLDIFSTINDVQTNAGNANEVYLKIDGVVATSTLAYNYDNGSVTTGSPNNVATGVNRMTPVQIVYTGTMTAGWHTLTIVMNPKLENIRLRGRSIWLDITYDS